MGFMTQGIRWALFTVMILVMSLAFPAPSTANDCIFKGVRTAELALCHNKDFQEADNKLNKMIEELKSILISKENEKLQETKQAWLKYRNNFCDLNALLFEGGTIQSEMYVGCLISLTNSFTKLLHNTIKCTPNAIGC